MTLAALSYPLVWMVCKSTSLRNFEKTGIFFVEIINEFLGIILRMINRRTMLKKLRVNWIYNNCKVTFSPFSS